MGKLIVSFIGLPGSGKTSISGKLAQNQGFKLIPEIGNQLILERHYKTGIDAPFEFDNNVFMKTKSLAQEILISKDRKIILEAGPPMPQMFTKARAEIGKHKEPRKSLLQAYDHHDINNLMENTYYFFLFMPPQIAISRTEERDNQELDAVNIDFLHFLHKNMMEFYKANKNRVFLIDVVGKTEDEIYNEIERKALVLVQKELG
ncbi:MAG: deoxynucleoside kinase [Candidatus Aenigmatarchaeota archaeon]